jgi:hypothetical protein
MMKKMYYVFAALLMGLAVSCGNKTPENVPAETEGVEADAAAVEETVEAAPVAAAVHKAAFINDPDGYTNVREQPNAKAKIVAKIVDGERFFYDEEEGSKWVKVYRTADADAACIGYMHGSRVMPADAALSDTETTGSDVAAGDDAEGRDDAAIESYLREYERFVKEYADFAKKFDKNDPSTLAGLAKINRSAQELAEKGEKVKSMMTTDQMNRLNKFNMKMAEAIKTLQEKQQQ